MTLLLGLAAVNTGNNLLYLLESALLGVLIVSGVFGRANLCGLRCRLEVPEEIYDGTPALASLRLTNAKRRMPSFLLQVEGGAGEVMLPLLAAGEEGRASLPLLLRGRGRSRVPPVVVRSVFPINFFLRAVALAPPEVVVVFPAPRAVPRQDDSGQEIGRGDSAGQRRGFEGEVHHIRDYAGADPLRRIHWKLSARQETLKVKEMSAAVREPLMIDPGLLPGADLEERLGVACYLVNRALGESRPVGLRLGNRAIEPDCSRGHRFRLLTELATYDPP